MSRLRSILGKACSRLAAAILTRATEGKKLMVWRDYGLGEQLVFAGEIVRAEYAPRYGDRGPTLIVVAIGTLPGQPHDPLAAPARYKIAYAGLLWNKKLKRFESRG